MKNDVSIHISEADLKVIVLSDEVTFALKHTSDTFIGSRLAAFLGVVDTKTIRKYFAAAKSPKTALVKEPVFGRVAQVRALDRWNNAGHLQLFESLKSLMASRFTERHAFRILELVSIGQFSFDETYLKELGYRLAVIRQNEIIRRQPEPTTHPVGWSNSPSGWKSREDKKSESSDDPHESQRTSNVLLVSSITSSHSSSYSSCGDSSSSSSDSGSSSCD